MDTIIQDTLQNLVQTTSNQSVETINYWIWIAIIEFVIIIFLIIKNKSKIKGSRAQQIADAKSSKIDFGNIINSSFNAQAIYDELKKQYHPDKFTDPQKNAIATTLFQEITKNKHNQKKLLELKERAENELGIQIK